jgi:hypothetical protein
MTNAIQGTFLACAPTSGWTDVSAESRSSSPRMALGALSRLDATAVRRPAYLALVEGIVTRTDPYIGPSERSSEYRTSTPDAWAACSTRASRKEI